MNYGARYQADVRPPPFHPAPHVRHRITDLRRCERRCQIIVDIKFQRSGRLRPCGRILNFSLTKQWRPGIILAVCTLPARENRPRPPFPTPAPALPV